MKDSAPEKIASQRAAGPHSVQLEQDDERWGFEAARERRRQDDARKARKQPCRRRQGRRREDARARAVAVCAVFALKRARPFGPPHPWARADGAHPGAPRPSAPARVTRGRTRVARAAVFERPARRALDRAFHAAADELQQVGDGHDADRLVVGDDRETADAVSRIRFAA